LTVAPKPLPIALLMASLTQRDYSDFNKRLHDEFEGVVSELLYGNSLLQAGKDDDQHEDRGRHRRITTTRHPKQRLNEKQERCHV
jgi:hypothetical protein